MCSCIGYIQLSSIAGNFHHFVNQPRCEIVVWRDDTSTHRINAGAEKHDPMYCWDLDHTEDYWQKYEMVKVRTLYKRFDEEALTANEYIERANKLLGVMGDKWNPTLTHPNLGRWGSTPT